MDFATRKPRAYARIALGALTLATVLGAANVNAESVGIARLLGDSVRSHQPTFKAVLGLTGTTVSVDPVTGRLRQPTPGEMAALSQAMSAQFGQRLENVTVEQAADGTVTAYLGEAGLNVWIATVGADGKLYSTCVDDPAAAAAALAGGVLYEEQ